MSPPRTSSSLQHVCAELADWHLPTARKLAWKAVRAHRLRYEEAYSDALLGLAKALHADAGEQATGFMHFQILHGSRDRVRATRRNGLAIIDVPDRADPAPEPHVYAERAELWRAVDELPTLERQSIRLYYQYGLTQDEVAHRIGVSQMHVSRLLSQGRNRLAARVPA